MKKNSINEAWEGYKSSVRFDSYEISPCKQIDNGAEDGFDVVVCTVEEAELWELYGRTLHYGLSYLCNRPTKEKCEQALWEMFKTKEYKLIHA